MALGALGQIEKCLGVSQVQIGVDMIPEIEEKFKIINWLKGQRTKQDESFQKLSRFEQSRLISLNYSIGDLIRKLEFEINEIAKEYGNSYVDDKGNTVWVKSELKGE